MATLIRRDFLVLALTGTASLAVPCRAATSGEDEGEDKEQARLLAWLKKAGPADWHRCACTWNWDQPFDAIRWIIRQPRCDAGRAVPLFPRGEPSYYSKFASLLDIERKAGWA